MVQNDEGLVRSAVPNVLRGGINTWLLEKPDGIVCEFGCCLVWFALIFEVRFDVTVDVLGR